MGSEGTSINFECKFCNFQTKKYGSEWISHLLQESHQEKARGSLKGLSMKRKRRSVGVLVPWGRRRISPAVLLNYFRDLGVVMEFVYWNWRIERKDNLYILTFHSSKFVKFLTKYEHVLQNEKLVFKSLDEVEKEGNSMWPSTSSLPCEVRIKMEREEELGGGDEMESSGPPVTLPSVPLKRENESESQPQHILLDVLEEMEVTPTVRGQEQLEQAGTTPNPRTPTPTWFQNPVDLLAKAEGTPNASREHKNFQIKLNMAPVVKELVEKLQIPLITFWELFEKFNYIVWTECFGFKLLPVEVDTLNIIGWRPIYPPFKAVLIKPEVWEWMMHGKPQKVEYRAQRFSMQTKMAVSKHTLSSIRGSLQHDNSNDNDVESNFSFVCHAYAVGEGSSLKIILDCSHVWTSKTDKVTRALKKTIREFLQELWNWYTSEAFISQFDPSMKSISYTSNRDAKKRKKPRDKDKIAGGKRMKKS